jgi:VanZ family protein
MNRRLLTSLCVAYVLLVLYGSLMPFSFGDGWPTARRRIRRGLRVWPLAHRRVSRTDLASNFALYVPLGMLVAARWTSRRYHSRLFAVLGAAGLAAVVSAAVEFLQAFSPTRVTGVNDVAVAAGGALAGALPGALFGWATWVRMRRAVRRRWSREPASLLAMVMMAALAAEALFPYLPTLDVSTLARNVLRRGVFSLPRGLAMHPWHYWLVRRVAVYAVLAALLGKWHRGPAAVRWLAAAFWTTAFATLAELAKFVIMHRPAGANVANVAMSAAGAAAGVIAGWMLEGRLRRRGKAALAVALLAGYVVYLAWEPFNFSWDVAVMTRRLPAGRELLPLYHYAMRGRPQDAFLFVRTLTLLAALTYAATMSLGWLRRGGRTLCAAKAALLAGLFGLILEAGQLALAAAGRVPSVTDVCCFAAGGVVGSLIAGSAIGRKAIFWNRL